MLNRLWAAMILLGVAWAGFHGTMSAVTEQILDSAEAAVQLCITMLGVMAMWTGVMKVAEKAGILEQLTKLLNPFLGWMFPRIPKNHPAKEAISVNVVANILGLGWAATPAGLKAMEELAKLEDERRAGESGEKEREDHTKQHTGLYKKRRTENPVSAAAKGVASNEMCTFLILNISSLQLLPVNIIAYRSQYGSANPAVIVGPSIAATVVSTVAAVIFCKIMEGKRRV